MQEAHKRRVFAFRVNVETPDIMDSIAKKLGYLRVDGDGTIKGSTGVLLDKIAKGELMITVHNTFIGDRTMNVSSSAIKMLGDMLEEKEQSINDANPATEIDLAAVNELWLLYQAAMS